MGSDMANVKTTGKSSNSNLKVPPLKIVLSSHQNNSTFINTQNSSSDGEQADARDKDKLDSETVGDKQLSRKNSRASPDRRESDLGQSSTKSTVDSSSSSSSNSSSDRSTTTSPSSESESLDSNLTIISENHQVKTSKIDRKEDSATQVKQERNSRHGNKSANERPASTRKSNDVIGDTSGESTATNSREHTSNANQRITRSSQRAAQQNRPDNSAETNGDDSCGVPETPEKTVESARKAKRRKVESQEGEQDNNAQQATPQVIPMADICPADYKPPTHNSFELYRDIRKRPYEKMLQLNHVHPKTPLGFKDYLLTNGPYLLDGNRLGVGLNGSCVDNSPKEAIKTNNSANSSRVQLQVKLSNLYKKLSISQTSHHRHNAYAIPKVSEVPKSLRVNSALYKLFQVQEKARHQMKMQHLKERERSILAAEQEILRAYNKMAIADNKQKLHLSACTYFYYQESYHYLDDSIDSKKTNTKTHDKDQSSNCFRGSDKTPRQDDDNIVDSQNGESQDESIESDMKEKKQDSISEAKMELDNLKVDDNKLASNESCEEESSQNDNQESKAATIDETNVKKEDKTASEVCEVASQKNEGGEARQSDDVECNEATDPNSDSQVVTPKEKPLEMSDEELKTLNKSVFLEQLQAIDDKWAKIKREMFVRHKNESDSLYAVQSLEWEWRAKEIGACDIRVTPKIEPEFVPRVEVCALDY